MIGTKNNKTKGEETKNSVFIFESSLNWESFRYTNISPNSKRHKNNYKRKADSILH